MKIYCFYIKMEEIDTDKYPAVMSDTINREDNFEYSLYAYTPEKYIRNIFVETRNMNIFFEKVITMTNEEYEEFCDDTPDYLLEYHTYKTKVERNGKYAATSIPILSTRVESDNVLFYDKDILQSIMLDCITNNVYNFLKNVELIDELKDALEELDIGTFMNICFPLEDTFMEYSSYDVDGVGLFVQLYSNTFKN